MLKVKICGLRRVEDTIWANNLLPDYVGFVFAESKRRILPESAADISKRLDKRILKVGVFVNPEISFVESVLQFVKLDIIQLHGNETGSFCKNMPMPVWKAFRIESSKDLFGISEYSEKIQGVVLDRFDTVLFGGSGKTFDWSLAAGIKTNLPIILAGGLNSENLERAVSIVKPEVVDVSSSVEKDGYKDEKEIRKFLEKARGF